MLTDRKDRVVDRQMEVKDGVVRKDRVVGRQMEVKDEVDGRQRRGQANRSRQRRGQANRLGGQSGSGGRTIGWLASSWQAWRVGVCAWSAGAPSRGVGGMAAAGSTGAHWLIAAPTVLCRQRQATTWRSANRGPLLEVLQGSKGPLPPPDCRDLDRPCGNLIRREVHAVTNSQRT